MGSSMTISQIRSGLSGGRPDCTWRSIWCLIICCYMPTAMWVSQNDPANVNRDHTVARF